MKRNMTKTVSDNVKFTTAPMANRTVKMKTVFAVAGQLPFGQPFQYRPTFHPYYFMRVFVYSCRSFPQKTPAKVMAGNCIFSQISVTFPL